jgi:hypothetical protein
MENVAVTPVESGADPFEISPEEIVTDTPYNDSAIPDAIGEVGSSKLTQPEESAADPESAPALTGENLEIGENNQNVEQDANGSSSAISQELVNIHKLLSERLPEQTDEPVTEAQEETLESESEITLQDVLNEVSSIREYESEQLDELRAINSNLVISGNNSNIFGKNILASVLIIWGALIAGYFFSKII